MKIRVEPAPQNNEIPLVTTWKAPVESKKKADPENPGIDQENSEQGYPLSARSTGSENDCVFVPGNMIRSATSLRLNGSAAVSEWRHGTLRAFSRPFFIISTIGWAIISGAWLTDNKADHLYFQIPLYLFILLPCIVVTILSFLAEEYYDRVWEWTLCIVVASTALVQCLMVTTLDACHNVEGNTYACYTSVYPSITCVYFFMPLIFGSGAIQGFVGNSVGFVIMVVTIALGSWVNQDLRKLLVLCILSYAASITGLYRTSWIMQVEQAVLSKHTRHGNRLKRRLEVLLHLEKRVDDENDNSDKLMDVQNALSTALSEDTDRNIRERAWKVIMLWAGDTETAMRKSQAYHARDNSQQTPMDQKHGLTVKLSQESVRGKGSKMTTVAGISTIRYWMRRLKLSHPRRQRSIVGTYRGMVFLGGSCNPTTWRKDVAIPVLEKACTPFYNPQVDDWTPDLVEVEAKAKEDASVLFFVIDDKTCALASMMEVIELSCSGRQLVCVIHDVKPGFKLKGEALSEAMIKDLNRSRAYTRDVAMRFGVPLCDDIQQGLDKVLKIVRKSMGLVPGASNQMQTNTE